MTELPKDFHRVNVSAGVSSLGDGFTLVSLPLLATAVSPRPWAAAGCAVAAYVAGLLVALPSGVLADRMAPRPLMIAGDVFRAAVMLALGLFTAAGLVGLELVCLAAFAVAFVMPSFASASRALVARVVDKAELPRANGRLEVAETLGLTIVGPALGGFAFVWHASSPFFLDAVTYLLSAAVLAGLHSHAAGAAPESTAEPATLPGTLTAGLRALWAEPFLRLLMIVMVLLAACQAGTWALIVPYARLELGLGPVGLGWLLASAGVGGVAGGWAADRADRLGPGTAMLGAVASAGTGYALMGFLPSVISAVVAQSLEVFAVVLGLTIIHSAYQRRIPQGLVGRVSAAVQLIALAASLVGGGVAALCAGLGPVTGFMQGAFVCLAGLFLISFRRLRRLGAADSSDEADEAAPEAVSAAA